MSDITSLVIPKSLISKAKENKINCSEVARLAIEEELKKKEQERPTSSQSTA